MPKIPFYLVNAFTREAYAGNPAGVFFDDEAILSAAQMRQLAGEIGLESGFVTPAASDSGADFCLRYFTDVTEVPFCGHDTVSATAALIHAGRATPEGGRLTLRYQTPVGIIAVDYDAEEGRVTLNQNRPEVSAPLDAAMTTRVLAALGLDRDALLPAYPIQRVTTGTPFLIVPVSERASVDAAPASFEAIAELSRETGTFGIYVFALVGDAKMADGGENESIWSRCFAPIAGLNEDPVTGSASGALAGYLAEHGLIDVVPGQTKTIVARQGFGGGRGGTAQITVGRDAQGRVDRIAVAGNAVIVAEGSFTV